MKISALPIAQKEQLDDFMKMYARVLQRQLGIQVRLQYTEVDAIENVDNIENIDAEYELSQANGHTYIGNTATIINALLHYFGIPFTNLRERDKTRDASIPRLFLYKAVRVYTELSDLEIGGIVMRNSSAVVSGLSTFENLRQKNKAFNSRWIDFVNRLEFTYKISA